MPDTPLTLETHDAKSDARAESIKDTIREHTYTKGDKAMSHTPGMNIFNESADIGTGAGGMGGIGGGILGGALTSLLFNRKDGVGDNGAETRIQDGVFNAAVLGKLGSIEAAIPFNEAQVQLALANTAATATLLANTNQTATVAGLTNVKDSVQAQTLFLSNQLNSINQNVSAQGCETREAVAASTTAILQKIDANTIANLQAELAESRHIGRSRDVEVNVSQNVNQQQAQVQAQAQIATLANAVNCLVQNHQDIRQGIVNLGTMVGNSQTAANTKVQ